MVEKVVSDYGSPKGAKAAVSRALGQLKLKAW